MATQIVAPYDSKTVLRLNPAELTVSADKRPRWDLAKFSYGIAHSDTTPVVITVLFLTLFMAVFVSVLIVDQTRFTQQTGQLHAASHSVPLDYD